ncbi:MAG: hypothetical protein AABW79_01940 [Nanoarchaeota archaeon]
MRRGQIGQTITFVPVFILTILLMFLFVAISAGFCIVKECKSSNSLDVDVVSESQIESRVLGEMFFSDSVEFNGEDIKIRDFLIGLDLMTSNNKKEQFEDFKIIQDKFSSAYGCGGKNTLLIGRYQASTGNLGEIVYDDKSGVPVMLLVDYPSTDLNGINANLGNFDSFFPLTTESKDLHSVVSQDVDFVYLDGSFAERNGDFVIIVKGNLKC